MSRSVKIKIYSFGENDNKVIPFLNQIPTTTQQIDIVEKYSCIKYSCFWLFFLLVLLNYFKKYIAFSSFDPYCISRKVPLGTFN